MFTPADAALAGRDPGLPGLRVLLDTRALAARVRPVLGETTVEPLHLRYKPGTSAVLGIRADTPDGPVFAAARCYTDAAAPKFTKDVQQAPAESVLHSDPHELVVVSTLAADRDLPGVAMAGDPERVGRLLGTDLVPPAATTRILRYNPNRRLVATMCGPGGSPVVLRVVPPQDLPMIRAGYRALDPVGVRTPAPVGHDRRRGVLAVEWLDGQTLDTTLYEQGAAPEAMAAVGAAVARLHGTGTLPLPRGDQDAPVRLCREAATSLRELLPDVAGDVAALLAGLEPSLSVTGPVRPVHGDLAVDQVIVTGDREIGVVDWDRAHTGDAVTDLASTQSALLRDEVAGTLPPGSARAAMEALLEGYRAHLELPAPGRIDAHTAAHLLRRAVEPFRRRRPEWPDQVRRLVTAAREVMPASGRRAKAGA